MTDLSELDVSIQELGKIETDEKLKMLDVIEYPNNLLKFKSRAVDKFEGDYDELIRNMFYTLKRKGAVAISAPQVGVSIRLILINLEKPLIMFNPTIIFKSTTLSEFEEGNLNIPGYFNKVKRYDRITVVYQNELNEHLSIVAEGLLSAVVQHEIEILNGKTFLDKLSPVSKFMAIKKIKKLLKNR